LEGDDNTFYFIFDECSFTEENVTDADRTLGTAEYLVIPIDGEEATYKLDASAMLKTYDAEDFGFLKEGDGIKLLSQKEDPEEDDVMIDTYGSMLSLGDDGFIGADGYFLGLNDDNGIALTFKPETFDGNNINLEIWNNPEANITIGDGKVVNTKLVISQSGWYYLYNITLMSSADKGGYDQAVKDVEEKIEAIDEVVTLDSKAVIDAAREAFDALPEYGQKNVSNYAKLTAAEAEYKRLADIKDCIDKIDAIGEVVLTEDCKALIDAARSAYDALSDASKEAITNYQTLVDAEKKYADLEAAGIVTVTAASAKDGIMYDLMGRKVTKATKGLYILNGKKYFQK
jgi:CHASE3 domain sensor protein